MLRGLSPGTIYMVRARGKLDGISYNGYWSAWTQPVSMETPPAGGSSVTHTLTHTNTHTHTLVHPHTHEQRHKHPHTLLHIEASSDYDCTLKYASPH